MTFVIINLMITRDAEILVRKTLKDGLVAILYGPRQVGKTTLANTVLSDNPKSLYLNCDDPAVVARLQNQSLARLQSIVGDSELVVIDEAQRVENIGITAKLIHDEIPSVKLLLTGSSSLDLANKIKEPLTGRSHEILLYPLRLKEVASNIIEADGYIHRLLVLGGYPGLWSLTEQDAADRARELANNYLYRDAFALGTIYDRSVIDNLLRLLAHQVGSEVSYSELASHLEVSKETVMRYIDLLEKAFIIFRRPQFRKNQRVQVGRLRKIYFYDLGMRNALIDNFSPIELRSDTGALWENFALIERLKKHQAESRYVRSYYWRSRDNQEIDLIEEISEVIKGYECKWSKPPRIPKGFRSAYPDISVTGLTKDNYWEFL